MATRDVPYHHHHVPKRSRRPHQFLALGRRRDRQFGDVFLVDGERRFLGAGGLPVRDRRPGAHLSRPDHQDSNTELAQCLSESEVEAVQAGLGRSVDEVRAPHPLTGGRAHRDDPAEALCAHLLAEEHSDGNRSGVVDLGDLHGLALVLPQFLGVAEQTERHDRHVDIAARESRVDHFRVAFGVDAVEVDPLDGLRSGGLHLGDGVVALRVAGDVGQHDAGPCIAQVALADRQPDLGGASEQQDGLGITGGVENHLQAAPSVGPYRMRRHRSDRPCGAPRSTRR